MNDYVFTDPNGDTVNFTATPASARAIFRALLIFWAAEPVTLGFVDGPQFEVEADTQDSYRIVDEEFAS